MPTFELTPLSTLIQQSWKDIEILRNLQGRGGRNRITIDFNSIEANLRGFEEVYKAVSFSIFPLHFLSFHCNLLLVLAIDQKD